MTPEIKEKTVIFPGHAVEFTYTHYLNSKSSTEITKSGIAVRQVRGRSGLQRPTGYWMVKLDGNKTLSRVHESRLINRTLKSIK